MIIDRPITPPASPPHSRISTAARVVANVPLCRDHFRIDLLVDRFPDTEPGQFVQLACRDERVELNDAGVEHSWGEGDGEMESHAGTEARWPTLSDADLIGRQAMLRRPFSLAGRRDQAGGVVLSVIHRVIGVGTEWLSHLRDGDEIGVLGPLGNRFPRPANGVGVFVAGGVGIPPMLYLAERWSTMTPNQLTAFCGGTTRDLLPLMLTPKVESAKDPVTPSDTVEEFRRVGVDSVVSTDDGTFGFHGLVTTALERSFERSLPMLSVQQRPTIYTCGPEPMMKRVAEIALGYGLNCFVAVERSMACGMGTCQSCVIPVRRNDGCGSQGSRYALSCTEGPIFNARDLLW